VNKGGNVSAFTYGGFGRCVQIVESTSGTTTATRRFVWCGTTRCEERDANNNVTKRFSPEGEQIAGNNYYSTFDRLGSVQEMTDASGNIRAQYDYDPYGNQTKLSGDLTADFGFAGYYNHANSGLYLTVFRAYDPDAGRWLSRDPIGEAGGVNLYGYVGDDPPNLIDPLGLISFGLLATGDAEGNLLGTGNPAGTLVGEGGANLTFGGGVFHDPTFGLSLGGFIGGGAFLGTPLISGNIPCDPSNVGNFNTVLGKGAGVGSGFWFSNAGRPSQLGGDFKQVNFNVIKHLSLSFAWSGGTWIFSASLGKCFGSSASYFPTTTPVAAGLNLSGHTDVY
jgi:RHS repeat-associated protein